VRIIAGSLKGRRLKSPRWDGVRPTSDRLRETLFNVLASRLPGARVLDGYAGTGAIGLEALSRGAAHVTFVEQDRRTAALIRENAAMCGVGEGYTIACGDFVGLASRSDWHGRFDLVVLDPPYEARDLRVALEKAADLLAPGGVVVLERATRIDPDVPPALVRVRDIRSGDSTLTMLTRAAPPAHP
jgi:16S rRNA (guanine(966)-N(2))-methyltransferase RsmD